MTTTPNKTKVKVIKDGYFSKSLGRAMVLNESIQTNPDIAEIWERKGLVKIIKPKTSKD